MPLSLPSRPLWQAGNWRLVSNAARFASPITRVSQRVARPGSFWACTLTVPPITNAAIARDWAALLAKLTEDSDESVYMTPPVVSPHSIGGAGIVNGANQTGTTLIVENLTPGDTARAGGFISYSAGTFRMLHMVVADAVASGAGKMHLPVRPMIRKSPADGAAVNFSSPSCEMTPVSPEAILYDLSDATTYGMTLDFVESVKE